MATKPVIAPSPEAPISRRGFLMKLGLLFNGLAAMVVALAEPAGWPDSVYLARTSLLQTQATER